MRDDVFQERDLRGRDRGLSEFVVGTLQKGDETRDGEATGDTSLRSVARRRVSNVIIRTIQ